MKLSWSLARLFSRRSALKHQETSSARSSQSRTRSFRPGVESLEDRLTPAVSSISFAVAPSAVFTTTPATDSMTVTAGSSLSVTVNVKDVNGQLNAETNGRTVGDGIYILSLPSGWGVTNATVAGNGLSGTITFSGTVPSVSSFNLVVDAEDNNSFKGSPATETITVNVNPAFSFNPSTPNPTVLNSWTASAAGQTTPAYVQGTAIAVTSGGTGSITLTQTAGNIPPGLTFADQGNGTATVTGTPTTAGVYTFTVTAADQGGESITHDYTITINPAISVNFASSLSVGTVSLAYGGPVQVSGGTQTGNAYQSISVVSNIPGVTGPFTPNLTTGVTSVSGTPTTVGPYTITVTVTDGVGATSTFVDPVSIFPPAFFNPVGVVTNPYTTSVFLNQQPAGVAADYTFSAFHANVISYPVGVTPTAPYFLPPGLTFQLDSLGDLIITGTPTTAGTYQFSVTTAFSSVKFGSGTTTGPNYSLTIYPAMSITTTSVTETYGNVSGQSVAATGGTPFGYTFTGQIQTTGGALASTGLTFNSNGTISGTPNTVGTFKIHITSLTTSFTFIAGSQTVVDTFTDNSVPTDIPLTIKPAPLTLSVTAPTTSWVSGQSPPPPNYTLSGLLAVAAGDTSGSIGSSSLGAPTVSTGTVNGVTGTIWTYTFTVKANGTSTTEHVSFGIQATSTSGPGNYTIYLVNDTLLSPDYLVSTMNGTALTSVVTPASPKAVSNGAGGSLTLARVGAGRGRGGA